MGIGKWQVGVLAAALGFAAPALAQSSATGAGSTGTGTSSSSTRRGGKLDDDLQKAVQKLHAGNLAEIQLGQTAQQNAQSPQVKQFAQRMIDDHQQVDQQLQQLASSEGVSLQGDEFQKQQQKMQKKMQDVQAKNGAEFDKAYMKLMVGDHKGDVKDFDKATKKARENGRPELATFFAQTDQKMKSHLQEAKQVQDSLGKGGASASYSGSGNGSHSGGMTSGASSTSGSGGTSASSTGSTGAEASGSHQSGTGAPGTTASGRSGGAPASGGGSGGGAGGGGGR